VKGIMLAIRPNWASMIYAGVKRNELRKSEPRDKEFLRQPERPIYLYETGTGLITGMCNFEAATVCTKASDAAFYSTVPPERVLQYGPGRDGKYHLWSVSGAGRFSTPLPVSLFGISRAPQSWCYVEVGAPDPFERREGEDL